MKKYSNLEFLKVFTISFLGSISAIFIYGLLRIFRVESWMLPDLVNNVIRLFYYVLNFLILFWAYKTAKWKSVLIALVAIFFGWIFLQAYANFAQESPVGRPIHISVQE